MSANVNNLSSQSALHGQSFGTKHNLIKAKIRLPPKFAVYARSKPISCKAEVEKAFTKLRWKREFERSKKEEGGDDKKFEEHRFYDTEGKNFDLTRLRPFNKKV